MFRAARSRLVAWNVAVFAVLLIALGIAAYRAFSSNVYQDVDQQLAKKEAQILDKLPNSLNNAYVLFINDASIAVSPYRIQVGDPSGLINFDPTECPFNNPYWYLHSSVPGPPASPCPPDALKPTDQQAIYAALANDRDIRSGTFRQQSQRVLTFVYRNPQNEKQILAVFQISRDTSAEEAVLRTSRLLLTLGGIIGVILAALGSLFLANRALVPIRQAFNRQRQFTADASHELRTPLSLIRANAEMMSLHGDKLPEGDCELLGEIIRETDHLNRLVSDLLTLARADTGGLKLVHKPVDLRSLVGEVHEDLHRVAESKGIDTSLSMDGPVTVQGDETRLRQLLLILMDNALKYTDAGGEVNVSLERDNGHVRVVVADTGIGIPAQDLPHIFERFYRVDRAREHESGGTGLGLAIARWIVQAHDGNIKVDSEQGKGTKFLIDLPAE